MNNLLYFLGVIAVVVAGGIAQAQQPNQVPRIAFLAGGSRSGDSLLIEAFWRRMKALGYIEGKNIATEYRFAEGVVERLPMELRDPNDFEPAFSAIKEQRANALIVPRSPLTVTHRKRTRTLLRRTDYRGSMRTGNS